MFENSIRTFNLIQKRKNEEKKKLEEDKQKAIHESMTMAKLGTKLDFVNMLLEKIPTLKQVAIQVPQQDENMINAYMEGKELENYNTDKHGLEFYLSQKKIEI